VGEVHCHCIVLIGARDAGGERELGLVTLPPVSFSLQQLPCVPFLPSVARSVSLVLLLTITSAVDLCSSRPGNPIRVLVSARARSGTAQTHPSYVRLGTYVCTAERITSGCIHTKVSEYTSSSLPLCELNKRSIREEKRRTYSQIESLVLRVIQSVLQLLPCL